MSDDKYKAIMRQRLEAEGFGNEPPGLGRFMRFLDTLPCTCRGEAHDECREEEEYA